MVLHECPFCHRPFEAVKLSKEQVDSSEVTKVGEFPPDPGLGSTQGGFYLRNRLVIGLSDEQKKTVALHPEAYITYQVSYRCKHCGKKWTNLSVEEVPLPREYVAQERED